MWDYFEVLGDRPQAAPPSPAPRCPTCTGSLAATLNYARNALRTAASNPDQAAIIYSSERGRDGSLSYRELADEVGRVAAGLRGLGVGKGDRVVALLPNIPEAVIGLLAAASIGAIWSSCSPDFGIRSVVDRWSQIEPAVLIAVDGYAYNGKQYPRADVVADIAAQLPSLRAVVMVDLLGPAAENPAEAGSPALPRGVALARLAGLRRGGRAGIRGTALRAPALGPLLLGNHRPAQADRARSGRHRARAPEVPRLPPEPGAGRPLLLVHHHRLDDVELPGRRAAHGHDHRALRRRGRLPGRGPAVAARRRHRAQLPRCRRPVPDGGPEGRARAAGGRAT